MNPYLHIIFSTAHALSRNCPKCGRKAVVPRLKRRKAVKCRHCGAEIPPKGGVNTSTVRAKKKDWW